MRKDIAQKWVDALRSGKYVQTQAVLTRNTEDGPRHCCLGVLCELAVASGDIDITVNNRDHHTSYDNRSGMPPGSVLAWAELPSTKADYYATMNDTDHASFDEIASAIENNNNLKKGGE